MDSDEVYYETEPGDEIFTVEQRKIFTAGRPYGTGNLRGMYGYSTGAISGNLPRKRIGISRPGFMAAGAGLCRQYLALRQKPERTRADVQDLDRGDARKWDAHFYERMHLDFDTRLY